MDVKRLIFRIRTLRIISQFAFFLLFNAVLFGFEPVPVLLPVLQSQGAPQRAVGDAFAVMQYMFYEPAFPWLPIASFIIFAVVSGRLLCGWACPFGFVEDILGYLKKKHSEVSPRTHHDLVYVKYVILGAVLFISVTFAVTRVLRIAGGYRTALGIFAQAPFNALSPHDTLFGILPIMTFNAFSAEAPFQDILGGIGALTPLFWTRFFILAFVLVFAVYTRRSWCRYLCPVGAMLALESPFSFLGLKRDVVRCKKEGCRSCVEACPMRVPILDLPWEKFTHPECIYCLECRDACETKALKPKFP